MIMLQTLKSFIKSHNKLLISVFILIITTNLTNAENGEMPIDNTDLTLPDGRKLELKRAGDHSHILYLKNGKKSIWKRTFEYEYDRLWDYAFFVPVKKGQYSVDVNKDGHPEIAIATWDGGNNIDNRYALVFSVLKNELKYYTKGKFNLEYGDYVLK